jgi:hypothetical protein
LGSVERGLAGGGAGAANWADAADRVTSEIVRLGAFGSPSFRFGAPTPGLGPAPQVRMGLQVEAVACYAGCMANPPLGREWPSRPTKTTIGVVVFMLGVLAGVGVAMWVMPPS